VFAGFDGMPACRNNYICTFTLTITLHLTQPPYSNYLQNAESGMLWNVEYKWKVNHYKCHNLLIYGFPSTHWKEEMSQVRGCRRTNETFLRLSIVSG